jgi:uncharacterized membrane protein required for colicin V production
LPITISQALDLLMALVLVMFVPIGLWRGALREWIALAGITFGSFLADKWAGPWGDDLASLTGMDQKLAQFTVAALFFLGTTLIVGYGGGVTLPYRPDLTWTNRLLGALLSLGNGTLILGGVLAIMRDHLFAGRDDSVLIASGLAQFLLDDIGWVYLGILAVFVCCVLIGLVRRWTDGSPLMEEYGPVYQAAPRDAWNRTWDSPPEEVWTGETTERFAQESPQETAVLQVVPPISAVPAAPALAAPSDSVPAGPRIVDISRPASRSQPAGATPRALNITPISTGNGKHDAPPRETVPGPVPLPPSVARSVRDEAPAVPALPGRQQDAPDVAPPAEAPDGAAASGGVVCGVCGTLAAPRARFCLTCGHIIGEPERRQVARQQ